MPSLARYGVADCPELRFDETRQRYVCGLAEELAEELAIGAGCSSSLNTWRRDVRNRDDQRMTPGSRALLEARAMQELVERHPEAGAEVARELLERFRSVWPELADYLKRLVENDKRGKGE